ncbi:TonB-dependent receptor [Pedobacter antarcticus 4BY]|uniref:TonB-dependent receptor n=2 Tax=Pedobacter antarcticus TaxID=34086 RepID=A0A081PCM9_9SPHI|nr:outer membrane beta-barrel family protein [Pedobacter antarcticus]KEQ28452.1 TonB-dependent receptor [Pedobacter antarcticus 4BY]SFF03701.1 CarboxypepD_reg-like domain-containing protein [Pedobacter antarcticus]
MRILFSLLLLPLAGFTQNLTLSGHIRDEKHIAVPYANITLKSSKDSSFNQRAVATPDGAFKFAGLAKDDYKILINVVGFVSFEQSVEVDRDMELPIINLQDEVSQLAEVQITTIKPKIIRKIDRVEFSVENTVLSSANAWEIVKRAPGVQSGGGELSLRGSKSILVTINDKKVYLSGDELKAFLESTGGNEVKSVEIITNPPAKYDASGSAVINIKLKNNLQSGYKGSINSSHTQGIYAKSNFGTNQYIKGQKFAAAANYTFGNGIFYNEISEITDYVVQQQTWYNTLRRKNFRDAEHTYRFNVEYTPDSLNTITIGTNGYIAKKNHALYLIPTAIYENGQYKYSFDTRNERTTPRSNKAYNISYEHRFSAKESLNLNADFTKDLNRADQDISTIYHVADSYFGRFKNNNDQQIRLFSTQLDYRNNMPLFELESGLKYSKVNADNKQDFQQYLPGSFAADPALSNTYRYDESVLAGYIGLHKEIKNWSLKAGLRAEHTATLGNSSQQQEMNRQSYYNLFPTFFAQNKLNDSHTLGLSYGRRISRPQYSYLNPSKTYFSPNSYLVGDAKLKPAITDKLSISYAYKGNYRAEAYYSYEQNPTIQLPFQDNVNNLLIQKVTNIPGNRYYGIDFSANFQLAPWFTIDLQAGPNRVESSFKLSDGTMLYNRTNSLNANIDQQYIISKSDGFSANVNFSFTTGGIQGPAKVSSMSSLNFSASKKLFSNRAEIGLMISDVYRGEKMTVSSNYADQRNSFTYYGDTQNIRFSFKYNLGNNALKSKALKGKTSEQSRL